MAALEFQVAMLCKYYKFFFPLMLLMSVWRDRVKWSVVWLPRDGCGISRKYLWRQRQSLDIGALLAGTSACSLEKCRQCYYKGNYK